MIKKYTKHFSVRMMCNLLSESTSSYYDWQDRPLSTCSQENAVVSSKIKAIFDDERSPVGTKRIAERSRLEGTLVSRLCISRKHLPPSYHGQADQCRGDYLVHTEFGADAWKYVILAGYSDCRLYSLEYPAAQALIGIKAKTHASNTQSIFKYIKYQYSKLVAS